MVAICGLLFVQICYDDFRSMLDAGAGLREFWRYLLVTLPSFLGLALPLALLFSLLFTLSKLHRAHELTSMRSAGVGYTRLMAPIWLVGVLACGIVWWLNSTVVPWSVEASKILDQEMQFRKQAKTLPPERVGAVYSVAFDNPRGQAHVVFQFLQPGRLQGIRRHRLGIGLPAPGDDANHRRTGPLR